MSYGTRDGLSAPIPTMRAFCSNCLTMKRQCRPTTKASSRNLRACQRNLTQNECTAAVQLAKKMGQRYRDLLGALIEGLTAAGAWKEAAEITGAAYDEIEDTTRTKPMRLHAGLRKIACAFKIGDWGWASRSAGGIGEGVEDNANGNRA